MLGNIAQDGALARLVKSAQAIALSGAVPAKSGRELVALAKSVGLFVEVREPRAARAALSLVESIGASAPDDHMSEVIARQSLAVRKAMKWTT